MRIELILTGSKPDAKSGFLRNPIAPLTGFGVPLRYAPITTRGRFERPDPLRPPAFQTSGFVPNPCRTSCGGLEGCIRPLCYPVIRQRVDSNHRNSFPFNSLAGSRNRPTLPRCHTKPAKRVRQGFSSEIPINICDRIRTCSLRIRSPLHSSIMLRRYSIPGATRTPNPEFVAQWFFH